MALFYFYKMKKKLRFTLLLIAFVLCSCNDEEFNKINSSNRKNKAYNDSIIKADYMNKIELNNQNIKKSMLDSILYDSLYISNINLFDSLREADSLIYSKMKVKRREPAPVRAINNGQFQWKEPNKKKNKK